MEWLLDAAFRGGFFREAKPKRFEFPDRDPKDWELIVLLTSPLSETKITFRNVFVLADWFNILDCRVGLWQCDELLSDIEIPRLYPSHRWNVNPINHWAASFSGSSDDDGGGGTFRDFDANAASNVAVLQCLMDILVLAVQNSLRKTKKRALGVLEQAMEKAPYRVPVKHVETLVSIMQQDKNCRDAIWAMLQKFRFLPPNLIQFPSDDLLENPLLPMLIAERTTSPVIFMKVMTSRVLQIVQQEGNTSVSQTLAEDSLIGRFVRPHLETIPPRNDSSLSLDHEHGV